MSSTPREAGSSPLDRPIRGRRWQGRCQHLPPDIAWCVTCRTTPQAIGPTLTEVRFTADPASRRRCGRAERLRAIDARRPIQTWQSVTCMTREHAGAPHPTQRARLSPDVGIDSACAISLPRRQPVPRRVPPVNDCSGPRSAEGGTKGEIAGGLGSRRDSVRTVGCTSLDSPAARPVGAGCVAKKRGGGRFPNHHPLVWRERRPASRRLARRDDVDVVAQVAVLQALPDLFVAERQGAEADRRP